MIRHALEGRMFPGSSLKYVKGTANFLKEIFFIGINAGYHKQRQGFF
jgi:hypothetical protein